MAEELNLKMDPNGIPAMLIDNQQKEWNLKLKEKNNSGNNIEISQDLQNKNIYLRSSFSTDQQINYRIMDLNGKILITSDILFSAGNDSVCICDLTTTLQPGLYILNLESKAFQKAVPILLQF
jgi:hypothetical protein